MDNLLVKDECTMKGVVVSSTSSHKHQQHKEKKKMKLGLLIISCIVLSVGQVGGPLVMRVYFLHGGQRKWLTSWLQTAAFPLFLIPILLSWSKSITNQNPDTQNLGFLPTPKLFISSVILGVLVGLDCFLYAFGLSYLPVSTSSLLMSTQLAFTAVFALILVKQKFTPYSINAVVLLSLGSIVLAFHTNGDVPTGVSKGEYFMGFFATLGGAAVLGFMLPLIEFVYAKACRVITYDLVMQMQFLIFMVATLVCTIPMLINKDFQAIRREAKEFGLGETKYYMVLVFTSLLTPLSMVGNLGVIYCATSLFNGVLITLLIPIQQIFAIFFFKEKFNAEKGMSLALSIWGFASYFYGEYKQTKKNQNKEPPSAPQEFSTEV